MAASKDNPKYTVYLVDGTKKYNITPAVTNITLSHQDRQLAQSATITAANIKTKSGKTICQIVKVRARIFIHANDGDKSAEVFRGWIWTEYHESDMEASAVKMKCYDNLIYLQESEDSLYFSKGKTTKAVLSEICNKWGIKLDFTYSSITHSKLVLRGTLSNIILSDILEKTMRKKGIRYVVYSAEGVMNVAPVGSNTKIYKIEKKENAVKVRYEKTMDDMVTKVKILGNAKDSGKVPVVATVKGNTAKYGTLQKLETKSNDDSLSTAKKEAKSIIQYNGIPTKEYTVTAPDIPWIKKGDKVYVKAGHITGEYLIVAGIERSISNKAKTMSLTLVEAAITTAATNSSSSSSANSSASAESSKSAWFEAMETQYNWSKHQRYKWVTPTVESSKRNGTCVSFVAISLQRIGYLPKKKYFYARPSNGKMVGNGADYVRNHPDKFSYSYPKKTVKQLAKEGKIEAGDIVAFKNPKYHIMVFMGFNKRGRAIFNTMGHNRGLKIPYSSYENRKVDLLVRLKL